jgi:hypothetical protein
MNEEEVIFKLKQLKKIAPSNQFRHTMREKIEQSSHSRGVGMFSLRTVGLTLAVTMVAIMIATMYRQPSQSPNQSVTGASVQLNTPDPTPTMPPTPITPPPPLRPVPEASPINPTPMPPTTLEFSIEQGVFLTPTPDPLVTPIIDRWETSTLPDEMLDAHQPFPILHPTGLSEEFKVSGIYLIETKFHGQGVRVVYSIPRVASIELTQFVVTDTAGLILDPAQTTFYTVGESDAGCYPLDGRVNMFQWSYGNYVLDMSGRMPCDELFEIAKTVR